MTVVSEKWRLSVAVRQSIASQVGNAPERDQIPTFLALLELDMQQLRFTETRKGSTRSDRLFARHRFAASLATNIHELLGVPLGRGRNGTFYQVLTASFEALELPAKDVRPYAISGIESATLSDKQQLSQIAPLLSNPGKRALKDELLSRRRRAERNRAARRRLLMRKGK